MLLWVYDLVLECVKRGLLVVCTPLQWHARSNGLHVCGHGCVPLSEVMNMCISGVESEGEYFSSSFEFGVMMHDGACMYIDASSLFTGCAFMVLYAGMQ